MSRPLLILRPEPGNSESVARAVALELSPLPCPLFKIVATAWEPPPRELLDGVIFTSANALRCAGPDLAHYLTLPAFAVGEATAMAARRAGFTDVTMGDGDVADLLDPSVDQKLLHLCGADVTETPSSNVSRRIVYASQIIERPDGLDAALALHPVAALHSARAAQRFAELVDSSGVARSAIALAALSSKVAAAAGVGWQDVAIAAKPNDVKVLEAAMRLIQQTKAPAFP